VERRRREWPHTRHRQNERSSTEAASSEAPHWPQYAHRTNGPISHDTINVNHDRGTGGCRSIADAPARCNTFRWV